MIFLTSCLLQKWKDPVVSTISLHTDTTDFTLTFNVHILKLRPKMSAYDEIDMARLAELEAMEPSAARAFG